MMTKMHELLDSMIAQSKAIQAKAVEETAELCRRMTHVIRDPAAIVEEVQKEPVGIDDEKFQIPTEINEGQDPKSA